MMILSLPLQGLLKNGLVRVECFPKLLINGGGRRGFRCVMDSFFQVFATTPT